MLHKSAFSFKSNSCFFNQFLSPSALHDHICAVELVSLIFQKDEADNHIKSKYTVKYTVKRFFFFFFQFFSNFILIRPTPSTSPDTNRAPSMWWNVQV